jgi:hypothetical protein
MRGCDASCFAAGVAGAYSELATFRKISFGGGAGLASTSVRSELIRDAWNSRSPPLGEFMTKLELSRFNSPDLSPAVGAK